MNKRLREILERKQEIRSALQGDGDINLNELETELRELDTEQKDLEKRQELAQGIAEGGIEGREIPNPVAGGSDSQVDVRSLKWDAAIETDEYRSAWLKDMAGRPVSIEERGMLERINDEYREFTHTTENSQILIPKTVAAGIWKRAEEQHALWADVQKFYVTGNLSMLKSDGNEVDAEWYDENTLVDTDELGFGMVDLTGCELAKAVQVTWKLKKMALPEFEAYLIREIGDRMGAALSKAVYAGKGKPGAGDTFKPEPRGIKTVLAAEADTPQIKEYVVADGVKFTDLTGVMAAIHSSYNGVSIYANNTTIWNLLANIVDGQGRPMFIADVMAGGVGRLFGRTIKPDATIPAGEILVGDLMGGYVANINEDITMYREDHVRARLTDYMGYAIVDGDVRDTKAFVILQAEVVTP